MLAHFARRGPPVGGRDEARAAGLLKLPRKAF